MDGHRLPRRRRPKFRVLGSDEWSDLRQKIAQLDLALEGLAARGRACTLDPDDVTPLWTLSMEIRGAVQRFERLVGDTSLRLRRPAELADPDRSRP